MNFPQGRPALENIRQFLAGNVCVSNCRKAEETPRALLKMPPFVEHIYENTGIFFARKCLRQKKRRRRRSPFSKARAALGVCLGCKNKLNASILWCLGRSCGPKGPNPRHPKTLFLTKQTNPSNNNISNNRHQKRNKTTTTIAIKPTTIRRTMTATTN